MIPDTAQQELLQMLERLNLDELIEQLSPLTMFTAFFDVIPLITFILTAISLYTIANRRGIAHPWLAWIPVTQTWILGSISDDYQQKANGHRTNHRKWLVGLKILQVVLVIAMIVVAVIAILALIEAGYSHYDDFSDWTAVLGSLGSAGLIGLIMAAVGVILTVLQLMSLYDLYRSCEPGNAVLYLVLNIFIGITQPILMLVVRSKDDGMPRVAEHIPERTEPWDLT